MKRTLLVGVAQLVATERSRSAERDDRFDLNQLVRVAQDPHAQQRAGGIVVAKVPPHYHPDGAQVLTALTGRPA
jgi:hypothetical protein